MAQMETSATGRNGRPFSRTKKQIVNIDMTPMVDLGFLLITFFVFTTAMSTPKATDLFMPKYGDPMGLSESLALTLLLASDDRIYYYQGDFIDALKADRILETNYSIFGGVGKVIRQKQKEIDAFGKFAEGRKGMMLLIKPTEKSNYKNVVDALDEAVINDVRKYAIVESTDNELEFIKNKMNSGQ